MSCKWALKGEANGILETRHSLPTGGKVSLLKGAAIAQWIHLYPPSCHPRFESHAHHLCFYQFKFEFKLWHVEKTKINRKRGLDRPIFKKVSLLSFNRKYLYDVTICKSEYRSSLIKSDPGSLNHSPQRCCPFWSLPIPSSQVSKSRSKFIAILIVILTSSLLPICWFYFVEFLRSWAWSVWDIEVVPQREKNKMVWVRF